MSQQPLIDLMPDPIRRQCEMGMRTGRIVGAIVIGVLIVVVLATQARWQLDREQQRLAAAMEQATTVLEAQRVASGLSKQLRETQAFTEAYERVALPLDISAVIATIINELPDGVTLESLDIEAGERRALRTSRGVTGNSERPPRLLVVELSGFALMNDDVSLLMMRLRNHPGFEAVTLDFNRTRVVRELSAREFRMSLRIDLDRPYEVVDVGSRGHAMEAMQ